MKHGPQLKLFQVRMYANDIINVFRKDNISLMDKHWTHIFWNKLEEGWVNINSNGFIHNEGGRGTNAVGRNTSGEFLWALLQPILFNTSFFVKC